MGDYSDSKQIDRIMSCPAGQGKLSDVRQIFLGKTITDLTFTNKIIGIGVHLRLDDEYEALIFRQDLTLDALLEDENIRNQERELYYQEYPDRKPKGEEENDKESEP